MENLLKQCRQLKKEQWMILVLAGVLLFVIAMPVSDEEKTTNWQVQTESSLSAQEKLETGLEEILESMEGVGKAQVLLNWEEEETKLLADEESGNVKGVLIAVSGQVDGKIKEEILEAVEVLFGIEAHKIKVIKMK
jgi:stage III sporulation protein AG